MKQSKLTNFKFTDYTKYIMLVPAVLIVLSIIVSTICAVCGVGYFNLDYDYRESYSFEIKFNATITDAEYAVYEDLVADVLEDNDITSYRFYKLGEGVYSRLEVKSISTTSEHEDNLSTVQVYLMSNLEAMGEQ